MTAAIHHAHLQEVDMHSLATIQVETAKAFNIPLADLRGPRRKRQFAMPRIVAMALAREMTGMSQPQIGRYFRRDHTTVLHAERRAKELSRDHAHISETMKAIRDTVEASIGWRQRSALELVAARAIADGLAGRMVEIPPA